jgi:hypothetical protein
VFGVAIPFILYAILFSKAKIIRYRFINSIRTQDVRSSVSVPNGVTERDRSTTAGNRTNSSTDEHNHRATVTFIILSAVIIGCALPPYILYTVQNILVPIPDALFILQIIIGRTLIYGLALADPIVILRNRDIRELFQRRADGSLPVNVISRNQLRRFSLASITVSSSN